MTFFRSETDFKDDIQNYINLVGTAQSAKRRSASGSSAAGPSSLKNKKAVEKPTRPKIDMEVIKAKLQSNGKSQHNNRDPTDLPETHSASVRAMKESLVQQFFGGANNSKAKGNRPVFELGSGNGETDSPSWSSVNKMKDMFEFGEGSNTRPQTQINSPEIKSIQVPEAFKKCKSENTGI